MSYKGFSYVLGPQLSRRLPRLTPPPRGRSPIRVVKTVVCVERVESCSEPDSDSSYQGSPAPSGKLNLKKNKSVRFEDSTDLSSGDESDKLDKSGNLCSTCGKRKSILKKSVKPTTTDESSDKPRCCCTSGKKSKGAEDLKEKNEGKEKLIAEDQIHRKDQTQNRFQSQFRPTATSIQSSFGPLNPGTRTQQLANRVKIHGMVQNILQPSRADVVRREDVIEQSSDPLPNAFFDQRSGYLRVYHGPIYGNPHGSLHGNPGILNPFGTFPSSHGGTGGFGYPSPYPNSPMYRFRQMNYHQPPQHYHCHQCNQQQENQNGGHSQQNNGTTTPRITSNQNPNLSKQSSPTGNSKSGGGWGNNSNGGSIPGAWAGDSHQNGRVAGVDNNSSAWDGNKSPRCGHGNSWGNDNSANNDTSKTNSGNGDPWNNNAGGDGESSNWPSNDFSQSSNTFGGTFKNDSANSGTSSNGGGDNWNSNSAKDTNWGTSWANNNSSGDNWNSGSCGNSYNAQSGHSWGNSNPGNNTTGNDGMGTGSMPWVESSNNKPPGSNSGGGDPWGAPANPAPWADPTAVQSTRGGSNNCGGDNWNSLGNAGGENWGENSPVGNDAGAWGTETALSGGSWADGGTGPTYKNGGW